MRKAFLSNDCQFLLDPLTDLGRQRTISLMCTRVGLFVKPGKCGFIRQPAKGRENRLTETPVAVAGLGDADGILERLRHMRELCRHSNER